MSASEMSTCIKSSYVLSMVARNAAAVTVLMHLFSVCLIPSCCESKLHSALRELDLLINVVSSELPNFKGMLSHEEFLNNLNAVRKLWSFWNWKIV